MRRFITILIAGFLFLFSQNASSQKLKDKLNNALKVTESKKFNALNPLDKANQIVKDMPWDTEATKPVALPEAVVPAVPEPLPDIDKVSSIEYKAAVSYAFECMRILYGDMTEKEAKQFMEEWAPIFTHPTQKIIDYLNKLNPLLSQFIVAHESYMRAYSNVNLLMFDMREAVAWDDKESYDQSMFQIQLYASTMKSLSAAMTEISNKIQALGDLPNPFEEQIENRKRYNRVVKNEAKEIYLGETWMGTNISKEHAAEGLEPLKEPLFRYLFKAKVDGKDYYYVIQLEESNDLTLEELQDPIKSLDNIRVKQIDYNTKDKRPNFTSDGDFRTYYPKPPVMQITTLTINYLKLREMSSLTQEEKKNPGHYSDKTDYHDAVCHFGNRVLRAGFYFKTAIEWSYQDKWNQYTFLPNGMIPKDCIEDFEADVRKTVLSEMKTKEKKDAKAKKEAKARAEAEEQEKPAEIPMTQEQVRMRQIQDSIAFEKKSRQESIETRRELIADIERQIRREEEYLSKAHEKLRSATTPMERDNANREIQDINYRLMHYKSNIQSERDNIRTLETGEYHHTRTVFDEYSMNKIIHDAKIEASRYTATAKAADIIDRQINLLPESQREEARNYASKILDEQGALAKGDIDKVKKLSESINNRLLAHELKVQAEAEDAAAWADLKEAGANAVIMASGAVTAGIASSSLTAAYGAEAAATIWGTKAVGMIYGGVTGYIAGGPKKAVSSIAGAFSTTTGLIASFVEGYTDDKVQGKSTKDKLLNGTFQAGVDFVLGKSMEFAGNKFVSTASAFSNKFKAKFTVPNKRNLDILRTQKQRLEAKDAVDAFKNLNNDYVSMLASGNASQAQLDATKKQIKQMSAALNSDYHAKWYMKYKADPALRAHFDNNLQENYREMIPKMTASLQKSGYDMSDIQFKQFRNSSSSGSSSMDLDLGAVSISKGDEPEFLKNGVKVEPAEFMKDAQQTMNTIWREQHGINAKFSEMNLTTSAHPEAYKAKELLSKDVNFAELDPSAIADIGRVLNVKVTNISNNPMMTKTTQLQAKAREANKEIKNMLLPKLQSDLKLNAGDKAKTRMIENDIKYWTEMGNKLEEIGTKASDPYVIMKLNNEIQKFSGGKDATLVVNDLIRMFNPAFAK